MSSLVLKLAPLLGHGSTYLLTSERSRVTQTILTDILPVVRTQGVWFSLAAELLAASLAGQADLLHAAGFGHIGAWAVTAGD